MATMPRPPAFGVWLSVPIIIPPGNAYCSSTTWWMMPGARLPEAEPVLRRHRPQELVDLGVHVERGGEVGVGTHAGLDQVVAVHRARHLHLREPGGGELQQRHLRGGVLHCDPVRPVVGVVDAAIDPDGGRIVGMGEEDLLGERERPPEAPAGVSERTGVARVRGFDQLDRGGGPGGVCHGASSSSRRFLIGIYAPQWAFHASGSAVSRSTERRQFAGRDIGDGHVFEDATQRGTHRDPDLGQPLGVALVAECFGPYVAHGRERTLDRAHHVGKGDVLGRARQPGPAVGTPLRGDDPGAPEVGEDVVEEVARDSLCRRHHVGLDQLAVGRSQLEHRPHCVVGLGRDLHAARPPLDASTCVPAARAASVVTAFNTRLRANTPARTGIAGRWKPRDPVHPARRTAAGSPPLRSWGSPTAAGTSGPSAGTG